MIAALFNRHKSLSTGLKRVQSDDSSRAFYQTPLSMFALDAKCLRKLAKRLIYIDELTRGIKSERKLCFQRAADRAVKNHCIYEGWSCGLMGGGAHASNFMVLKLFSNDPYTI